MRISLLGCVFMASLLVLTEAFPSGTGHHDDRDGEAKHDKKKVKRQDYGWDFDPTDIGGWSLWSMMDTGGESKVDNDTRLRCLGCCGPIATRDVETPGTVNRGAQEMAPNHSMSVVPRKKASNHSESVIPKKKARSVSVIPMKKAPNHSVSVKPTKKAPNHSVSVKPTKKAPNHSVSVIPGMKAPNHSVSVIPGMKVNVTDQLEGHNSSIIRCLGCCANATANATVIATVNATAHATAHATSKVTKEAPDV